MKGMLSGSEDQTIDITVPGPYYRRHSIMMYNKETTFVNHTNKQQLFVLVLLLVLILCLNYYDIIHSLQLIREGLAVEGNPLMRYLLERNPAGAIIIKMTMAFFFAVIVGIYSLVNSRRALAAAILVAALYILLTAWHLTGLYITNWYMSG